MPTASFQRWGRLLRWGAQVVGVHECSLRCWLAWYRQGGIAEVLKHRHGWTPGEGAGLNAEQQARLQEQSAQGAFTTIGDAVRWVQQRSGTD